MNDQTSVSETLDAMADLARWLHRSRSQHAGGGLTVLEASAVQYIHQGNDRPAVLAERLHIGTASLTALLKRLVKRSVLECLPGDGQRHTVQYKLTPGGEAARKVAQATITRRAKDLFEEWTPAELKTFRQLLERVASAPVA